MVNETPPFGRWIKRLRAELDLTQEALAERVGCAVQTIRTFENGARRPSRAMAERLADVLLLPAEQRAAFLGLARAARAPSPDPALDHHIATPAVPLGGPEAPHVHRERRPPLPVSPNLLIGREAEQAHLAQRLADPACRLLTLTGPGGIGKTRLALQLATNVAARFADGVAWVPLAPVASPDLLAATIASALGYSLHGAAPVDQLLAYLRDQDLLMVLDNFEHLINPGLSLGEGAAELLSTLLGQAPRIRLLATSRERLHIEGEWVVELGGLPAPPEGAHAGIEHTAAARLFIERARQARGDFTLAPENQGAVARICRLVAGMPLGIELAAAWVRVLTCAEIADELARGLDALTNADRLVAPRHRSLRAVFDHSWQLLTADERSVLARLAVFQGGCRRTAAEQVAGGTLPLLAALVDKSLLRRTLDATGAPRYDLHPLVRQYAADKLRQDPADYAAVYAGHGRFYASLLPTLLEGEILAAFAELAPDIENVRQAWAWASDNADQPAIGLMLYGLQALYMYHGWLQEGQALFGQAAAALQAAQAGTTPEGALLLGAVLGRYGYFLARSGHSARGEALLRESLGLLRHGPPALGLVNTLCNLGQIAYQRGAYAEAQTLLDESRALSEALGETFFNILNMGFLGLAALAQGDYAAAHSWFEQALALYRTPGNTRARILSLRCAAQLALAEDRLAEAHSLLQECLQMSSLSRDRWGLGIALHGLGQVALAQGDLEEACYLCQEAAEILERLSELWSLGHALTSLGWAETARDDQPAAQAAFTRAARLGHTIGSPPIILDALLGRAAQAIQQQQWELAFVWLVHIGQHPAAGHLTRTRAHTLRAEVVTHLAPAQAPAITAQAQHESFDAAMAQLKEHATAAELL